MGRTMVGDDGGEGQRFGKKLIFSSRLATIVLSKMGLFPTMNSLLVIVGSLIVVEKLLHVQKGWWSWCFIG